jgi:magnesium transporter
VDDRRAVEPASLQETYQACREQQGLAWIGLYEPTKEEFSSVAEEFGLHSLSVEGAIEPRERPKLDRYGEMLFVVLRRYLLGGVSSILDVVCDISLTRTSSSFAAG